MEKAVHGIMKTIGYLGFFKDRSVLDSGQIHCCFISTAMSLEIKLGCIKLSSPPNEKNITTKVHLVFKRGGHMNLNLDRFQRSLKYLYLN